MRDHTYRSCTDKGNSHFFLIDPSTKTGATNQCYANHAAKKEAYSCVTLLHPNHGFFHEVAMTLLDLKMLNYFRFQAGKHFLIAQ